MLAHWLVRTSRAALFQTRPALICRAGIFRAGPAFFCRPSFFFTGPAFLYRPGFFSPGRFSVYWAGFFFFPRRLFLAGPAFAGPVGSNRSGSKKPGFKAHPGFWPASLHFARLCCQCSLPKYFLRRQTKGKNFESFPLSFTRK